MGEREKHRRHIDGTLSQQSRPPPGLPRLQGDSALQGGQQHQEQYLKTETQQEEEQASPVQEEEEEEEDA